MNNIALPPPPPPPEGIILPPPRPTNDASGRIFILFVDDLHLDFKNTARVRDLLKKVKANLIHQGDMFGIVSSGPSSIAIDLTYDTKRIDEALKKVMGGALKPTDIIQGPEGQDGPDRGPVPRARGVLDGGGPARQPVEGAQPAQGAHLRQQRLRLQSVREVAQRRAGVLREQVQHREQFAGQRERGVGHGQRPVDGPPPARTPTCRGPGRSSPTRIWCGSWPRLTRAANRANATIYTLDPRGLVGMPDLDDNVDPVEFQEYITNSINSLRVLAEQTGGTAIVNQNDFDKALKRIDAETSDYYMIGYYSSNPDPLRRTRQVEVKVKRKDVDVWSRRSYSLRTDAPQVDRVDGASGPAGQARPRGAVSARHRGAGQFPTIPVGRSGYPLSLVGSDFSHYEIPPFGGLEVYSLSPRQSGIVRPTVTDA